MIGLYLALGLLGHGSSAPQLPGADLSDSAGDVLSDDSGTVVTQNA